MTEPASPEPLLANFDDVTRVVSDEMRFKLRLGIGADAYTSMKFGKRLQELWDIGGVAATGGGVAASSSVAATFFAPTGWLAAIGLGGAAATPIGWIAAAALASGATYYGVTRLFRNFSAGRIDTIPKFINTPIDLLGANLLDLIGPLAVKLALIDGHVDPNERQVIHDHFVRDWGFDADYVTAALDTLFQISSDAKIKDLARALSDFKLTNPDCNYDHMRRQLIDFLRDVAEADSRLDEREEMVIERIDAVLSSGGGISFSSLTNAMLERLPSRK